MFDRERLRTRRHAAGLNVQALAKRAGMSESAILGYEAGRRLPTSSQLAALCDALDCSADFLLGRRSEEVESLLRPIERDPALMAALRVLISSRNAKICPPDMSGHEK